MNQYQRMVSYLYEYKQGVKGANVGYVKIEQRGRLCRISLQMRGRNLGQLPSVTLFRQEKKGILCLSFCKLSERNGDYSCRVETDMDNLSGSGISLQEVEGLLLYLSEDYYVATTWKNSEIYLGEMKEWEPGMVTQDESVQEIEQEEKSEAEAEDIVQEADSQEGKEEQAEAEMQDASSNGQNVSVSRQDVPSNGQEQKSQGTQDAKKAEGNTPSRTEIEIQEYQAKAEQEMVCGNCPFKRKNLDYGKRILMTFPAMRPFPNEQHLACARIEPQDLGCLPMTLWPLANNQFLLQGYYSYRHLIFAELGEKKYAIGVPGIYSSRDRGQARQFGFRDFRPICKNRPCMGGFGYWMMPLDILS